MMSRPDIPSHEVSAPDLGAVTEVLCEVLIGELLGLCDGFFRSASPVVHAELRASLISRGLHRGTALGWFIDVLSLTAAPLPLEVRAAAAAERPPVEG